ncbi:MAG: DNA-directed RNA polymerase subunit beta' [Phycisphaeraceae bacterium]|nr:DNA-directed RNA polymerase subunit beta' [Phycisphaeraceae bacterium]
MAEPFYDRVNDYGSVRISLASPNDIRSWSFGEVKKPETINYRTYRPERDGLFCERIFGPDRDYECACGKFKGTKFKGIICDRCGVKVTHSRVRRKRMGHINLAAPVVHIWFFKSMPSRLGNLLGMKTSDLEKVVYFQDYVVVDPGDTDLKERQLLTEDQYREKSLDNDYRGRFTAGMGAEAVKQLLERLDLDKLAAELREELRNTRSQQKIKDLSKRLKIVEQLRHSNNKAEWMVMDVIPVIPPDLRPLVHLDSGNFATSDLNDLYRRIINRNNRLKKLMDLNAPEVIIRNEKRMLQQSVDALFDNGRCRRPVLGSSNRPLKSLTDMIKGKQGRFRENLLGKRVDYSARSVIVIGPELKLYQCGLPKKIALELYQPFIIRKLKDQGLADTIKSAKKMLERRDPEVWDILEQVIHQHPGLLNRAPTLHRMGIQAFEPVLVEGNAIRIHPLVCTGFNADFDGDQMAVHLPLSVEAQAEAHILMLSPHNVFSPANGQPIISPSQDIVLGVYYITLMPEPPAEDLVKELLHRSGDLSDEMIGKMRGVPEYRSIDEAMLAYDFKKVGIHDPIVVKIAGDRYVSVVDSQTGDVKPWPETGRILTTIGRLIFNDILADDMPFYNCALGKKGCSRVIADTYAYNGRPATLELLDRLKDTGFKRSTIAGISFGLTDLRVPTRKFEIIAASQKRADRIEKSYQAGAITERERYSQLLDIWFHCREEITKVLLQELKADRRDDNDQPVPIESTEGHKYVNPVWIMSDSGARGNVSQIQQLAGMRGLMSKPSGEIIETPIKANAREGLSVIEFFSSTHGARKGLADTALKTADSGYLTRKLADVAQNVFIAEHDCGTMRGVRKRAIYKGEEIDVPLRQQITGRIACETIRNPITDELIVDANTVITNEAARKIESLGVEGVTVRSPLTCDCRAGVCALCYGNDLSANRLVEQGMAVGIIGAQSIGEPGTQLTMRTFHTGGIGQRSLVDTEFRASFSGIVKYQNLDVAREQPSLGEEAWVADKKTGEEAINRQKALPDGTTKETTETRGYVALKRSGDLLIVDDKDRELERFKVPYGAVVWVEDKQEVRKGKILVRWDPHRIPILAEKDGRVRFEDIELGETVRFERQGAGSVTRGQDRLSGDALAKLLEETGDALVVIEHKGEKHPRIFIEDTVIGYDDASIRALRDSIVAELKCKLNKSVSKEPQNNLGELAPLVPRVVERFTATTMWFDGPDDPNFRNTAGHKKTYGLIAFRPKNGTIQDGFVMYAGGKTNPLLDVVQYSYAGNTTVSQFANNVKAQLEDQKGSKISQEELSEHIRANFEFSVFELAQGEPGKILDFHYLPAKARIEVKPGEKIQAGRMLARQPREAKGTADIVGGLPRVTEVFEARKPKEAAVLAEISGGVELRSDKRKGKMTIIVRSESGIEHEHHVPQDRHLLVHAGDRVEAGDPLIDGPLVPHDILRIKGDEALFNYLLDEVQTVYRAQGQTIDDKHIEIILSQMLRKVKVDTPGDTNLLPNEVVDKFRLREENERIAKLGRVKEPGGTSLVVNSLVTKSELKDANARAEAEGKDAAKVVKCKPATGKTLLLGITKASLQSESFLSGASFQETTKVLTEASLASKVDTLVGLKENVLLGHLIPAGTGFKDYLNLRVRKLAEPVEEIAPTREEDLEDAAARAEAVGALRGDEIESTVGESERVKQMLGDELVAGNGKPARTSSEPQEAVTGDKK